MPSNNDHAHSDHYNAKNISYYSNARRDYVNTLPSDSGMMDRTHLHWFTPESFRELFEKAGVVIDRMKPLNPLRRWERLAYRTPLAPLVFLQIDLHGHYDPAERR